MKHAKPGTVIPCVWTISADCLEQVVGGYAPHTIRTYKHTFVIKPVNFDRLPSIDEVVLVQRTVDTRRAYSYKREKGEVESPHEPYEFMRSIKLPSVIPFPYDRPREVVRVYRPREVRHVVDALPKLLLVSAPIRRTNMGALTTPHIEGDAVILSEGWSHSATGNHGQHFWLVLVHKESTCELVVDRVSNSGRFSSERRPVL